MPAVLRKPLSGGRSFTAAGALPKTHGLRRTAAMQGIRPSAPPAPPNDGDPQTGDRGQRLRMAT